MGASLVKLGVAFRRIREPALRISPPTCQLRFSWLLTLPIGVRERRRVWCRGPRSHPRRHNRPAASLGRVLRGRESTCVLRGRRYICARRYRCRSLRSESRARTAWCSASAALPGGVSAARSRISRLLTGSIVSSTDHRHSVAGSAPLLAVALHGPALRAAVGQHPAAAKRTPWRRCRWPPATTLARCTYRANPDLEPMASFVNVLLLPKLLYWYADGHADVPRTNEASLRRPRRSCRSEHDCGARKRASNR